MIIALEVCKSLAVPLERVLSLWPSPCEYVALDVWCTHADQSARFFEALGDDAASISRVVSRSGRRAAIVHFTCQPLDRKRLICESLSLSC